ncbi:FtsB family cell division protein [Desulfuribacillus alkaliarsenatis]|uniref:Septum formation initiator n=1 Tax=Desulfuribacillus alkaliarsenatis TaxID=766136 RepID=A0A1E5FZV1_9FIRM|nr:septum formation initiator family protein [Desulfuribacillus alkaliarsenatis]OEF95766.1 hypothetical protein BHF68_11755 [Desulfuribacillus alkaliarsenatis]
MYRPIESNNTSSQSKREKFTNAKSGTKKLAKWKKLLLLIFLVYLLFIGKGIYSQEQTISEKQQELEILQQEYSAIKSENEVLESRYNRLHDEDYIAEIARQNYYLSKPGEILFIVPQGR